MDRFPFVTAVAAGLSERQKADERKNSGRSDPVSEPHTGKADKKSNARKAIFQPPADHLDLEWRYPVKVAKRL